MTGIPRGVLAAEWIKLRSVRSTWVLLGCAFVLGVGDAVLSTSSVARAWPTMSAQDRLAFDPVGAALDGLSFGVLAFGTFGALVVAAEHGTGLIRTTLTAVPRRGVLFGAKAVVVAAVSLVAGQSIAFAAFAAGQAVLSDAHLEAGLTDPGVLRAVSGAGLYLSVVALVGLGLGALLRHSAAAIAAMFGSRVPRVRGRPRPGELVLPAVPARAGQRGRRGGADARLGTAAATAIPGGRVPRSRAVSGGVPRRRRLAGPPGRMTAGLLLRFSAARAVPGW